MSRIFLIAFLAAAFLAAPSAFGPAAGPSFSGSAQAGQVIVREVDKATPLKTFSPGQGNGNGQPGMAIKNSGVPKNVTKNISDGPAKGQASEGTRGVSSSATRGK
jgi:hypothetical protein